MCGGLPGKCRLWLQLFAVSLAWCEAGGHDEGVNNFFDKVASQEML